MYIAGNYLLSNACLWQYIIDKPYVSFIQLYFIQWTVSIGTVQSFGAMCMFLTLSGFPLGVSTSIQQDQVIIDGQHSMFNE